MDKDDRGRIEDVPGYLFTILRNVIARMKNKEVPLQLEQEPQAGGGSPDETADLDESVSKFEKLFRFLQSLPEGIARCLEELLSYHFEKHKSVFKTKESETDHLTCRLRMSCARVYREKQRLRSYLRRYNNSNDAGVESIEELILLCIRTNIRFYISRATCKRMRELVEVMRKSRTTDSTETWPPPLPPERSKEEKCRELREQITKMKEENARLAEENARLAEEPGVNNEVGIRMLRNNLAMHDVEWYEECLELTAGGCEALDQPVWKDCPHYIYCH